MIINSQKTKDKSFEYYAELIKNEIIQLNLKNIIFIGHCLGGNLALYLSKNLKSITNCVAIIDTSIPIRKIIPNSFKLFLLTLNRSIGKIALKNFIQQKMINSKYDHLTLMKKIKLEMPEN